ncbi:intraflagellar transport protein 43 homolog [Malaya genurostris]|uniref:intraflagellar transport protein 43 homolog n=1 Tax=Malaya genurostris TaxID=325434 RepID=UPI0026F393EC|nr:intraflagellar transport protein 43 homolog [Malaya genurostris]
MNTSSETAASTPTKQVKIDSWMDEVLRSNNVTNKGGRRYSNLLEMERFGNSNISEDVSPTEDIPMLPDADDLAESLLYNESPNLPSVTTYKQLGSDIFHKSKSALGCLDEIDISVLTETLESEVDIDEPDEPWTWDKLFAQLSNKISTETKMVDAGI